MAWLNKQRPGIGSLLDMVANLGKLEVPPKSSRLPGRMTHEQVALAILKAVICTKIELLSPTVAKDAHPNGRCDYGRSARSK
jgi:hypothetical protein